MVPNADVAVRQEQTDPAGVVGFGSDLGHRIRVAYLADDVALALYDHWFEIKIKAPGRLGNPRHGFDRVLSIYNRRDDGWRQSLYAQCPLGPDTYVKRMAEKLVGDDFDEFLEKVRKMDIQDPRLKK